MPRSPSPGRTLLRSLEDSATPLAVLTAARQFVFANSALGQWLGIDAEQLLGRRSDYRAGGDDPLAAAAAALCPPPEAFAGHADRGFVSRLASGNLPFERRPARFVLLAGSQPDENVLLLLVLPDSEAPPPAGENDLTPQSLHALLQQLRSQLGQRYHISQLIGESEAMRRVRDQVRVASQSQARVLVIGPPGSGREHVARTIHYAANAATIGPLVPIACPLVDAEQLQASLTTLLRKQHETPTERPPAALLLDVDRLAEGAQHELAGFLQLPGIELHTLATSRASLSRLAAQGKFRRDLAYALSTLTINLPPLKSRREDIPLLAQHFLEQANAAGGKQLAGFQPAALEHLLSLPWRGNLDDLARAVREACQRSSGTQIALADLPDWVHLAKNGAAQALPEEPPIQLDEFLAGIERELLQRALRRAKNNKSRAAELLGISRPRLLRRLAQLGLISPRAAEEPVIFEPLE
jgi:transcriptional regulator of acetoin/glycerol metabolism